MGNVTSFFDRYNELKAKFPGCPEEYLHRAINEEMGRECVHPLPLLRIGSANGEYLLVYVSKIGSIKLVPEDQMKGLRQWFEDSTNKAALWCPVCQTYPYPEITNESHST